MAYSKNVRIYLRGVTINNPHLFKKKATMEGGPEKYRANFTMDPTTKAGKKNIAIIEDAIETVKDEIGIKKIKNPDRLPLQDGNDVTNSDGDVYEGYEDMQVLRATNAKRPRVVDNDEEKTPITEDDDKIYGGAIVNLIADVYATDDKKVGGAGVFATLMGVQFVAEGERFGGNTGLADDAFDDFDNDDDDSSSKKSAKKSAKKSRDDDDEDDEDDRKSKKAKKSAKKSRDDEDEDDEDEDDRKSKKSKKPAKKSKSRDEDDEDDDEDI